MTTDRLTPLETPRLTLHALEAGDEARLQAAFEASADHFRALSGRPGPGADAAERELATCAATPGRTVALIRWREDGSDAGVIGWWEGQPSPELALLGMLMVAPQHRGKGVAREALGALEEALAARGVRALRTAFPWRRHEVIPVVRALGFREMSLAEHQKLGLGGAGTSLWEKPVGAA